MPMEDHHIQTAMRVLIASLVLWLGTMGCLVREPLSGGAQLEPGRHTLNLTVDGVERTYIVHIPPSYDPSIKVPIVVVLHGGGGTAKSAIWTTGWTRKADMAGFLTVFPNAMARDPSQRTSFSGNPQLWNDGSDRFYQGQKATDDVSFINLLLDDLSDRFNVDERRVFVTGFSNGASMSFLVGAQLSDRIAAIAPVAGACWFDPLVLKRPVPMLYITGTADPLNLIKGGVPKLANGASDGVRAKPKPPVRQSILNWAMALGCPKIPASVSVVNGVHTETYGPGRNGAEVVYISVDGLGHAWPGGRSLLPESMVGKTSDKINATDIIWDFFQKHSGSV
jgi:polyhydroxybutyrate depolymerase